MMDAGRHPRIEILTCSELRSLEGEVGAFRAAVRRQPTGVDRSRCTGCGDCAEVCPVIAPSAFDVGLGTRKAIFRPFPQAVPAAYGIDPELCLNDGTLIACERCRCACPRDAIDLEMRPRDLELEVGAVIVATGFDELDPAALRNYGYGVNPNVVTSLELERLLNASGPTLGHVQRPSDHRAPRSLVYIQCVGARGEGGHAYCSRFCCMNAVKDALLLKQHDPQVSSVTILYTDLRAFGKGFDEFCQRARSMDWIHFRRGRPARVVAQPAGDDLEVWVEDTESGRPLRIPAEMVVLSCAGLPAAGTTELVQRLGIDLDASGFIAFAAGHDPVQTSRAGILVCGSAGGPQVIPDCVAQGSAAAAAAVQILRRMHTGVAENAVAPSCVDATTGAPCAQEPAARGADGAQTTAEPWPDDGEEIWADEMRAVAEEIVSGRWADRLGPVGVVPTTGVDRAQAPGPQAGVGARESPTLGDAAVAPEGSQNDVARVGVFLCHCGINIAGVLDMEQLQTAAAALPGVVHTSAELFACSSSSQEAIRQAIAEHDLNRVVVAACTPRTHEPVFREVCRGAGLNPYLLEMANIRDQCSWVHAAQADQATRKARDLLRMAVARARRLEPLEPRHASVTRRVLVIGAGLPGMKAAADLHALGFEVELVERRAEVGGLLTRLHSLYPHRQAARAAVAEFAARLHVDGIHLHLNTEVREVSGYVGNFRVGLMPAIGPAEEIEVGAILLAIGAEPYQPADGEYGFGRFANVITSVELEQRLADEQHGLAGVRRVGFIQCVGSRDETPARDAHRGYLGCSRICCPTTVKHVLQLAERGIDTVVFYRDMRTVGRGAEESYRAARGQGAVFVRFDGTHPPRVLGTGERAQRVTVADTLLRADVDVAVDLIVLAVGLIPRVKDAQRLREMLKTPQGTDGFFMERHPELAPVETCVDGVVLCGAAQGPKDLRDALTQASAAAAKVAALLGRGELTLDPAICQIDAARCRACGLCVTLCEFSAPALVVGENGRTAAAIQPALCKGCGTCAVWCPTGAITARHFTDGQITVMIDELFDDTRDLAGSANRGTR